MNEPVNDGVKAALISAAAIIVAAIIGGIFLLIVRPASQGSAPPTPTPVPITSATTQPTSLTPTSITITENLQIPCAQCEYPVGLELLSIDINRNDNTTAFHLKITNNYNSGLTESFSLLSLQDDKGNTSTAGAGDAYDLGPGNSVIEVPIFPLALKQGVHYTLSVDLGGTGSAIYKDQSIIVS